MLLTCLKSYDRSQFIKDVTAGIIVAIIALPLSIALALASGVGPEAGIFTAIVAGFVISALGGSCVQIAGPTAAFATIVAGIVARDGMDFDAYLPHFKKLIPNEYKKMLTLSAKLEEKGLTSEQAQMEAFYESIGAKH